MPSLFESVLFGFDQYSIPPGERPKIMEVAEFLKENANARLIIEGHCDWKGTPEYNKSLGDRRATTVKNYLVDALSIDPVRVEVVSKGDDEAVPNADSRQAQQDRRANFLVSRG